MVEWILSELTLLTYYYTEILIKFRPPVKKKRLDLRKNGRVYRDMDQAHSKFSIQGFLTEK